MKPYVIYHKNCADGFGAAWCFWRKYSIGAEYFAGTYSEPAPDVAGYDVFLVDFSYPRAVVIEMLKTANSVTIIDHHKTAIDDLFNPALPILEGLINHADIGRSGAMLAWNYLFPDEEPPQLIKHIQDRDLWQFNLQNTRNIQACLFSYAYDFFIYDKLMSLTDAGLYEMTMQGEAIERKHHKDIDELLKNSLRFMDIGGYSAIPVANLPYTMSSDAGHLMAKNSAFAACYQDSAKGRVFSLRSAEDGVDVSDVAKQYGGGGHRHAAGFSVPRDHILAMS